MKSVKRYCHICERYYFEDDFDDLSDNSPICNECMLTLERNTYYMPFISIEVDSEEN